MTKSLCPGFGKTKTRKTLLDSVLLGTLDYKVKLCLHAQLWDMYWFAPLWSMRATLPPVP
jgi:hypothetical protein